MSSTSRVLREDELARSRRSGGATADPRLPARAQSQPRIQHAGRPAAPAAEPIANESSAKPISADFREGKALGKEQAAAELQPVLDRLGRSLAELSSLRSRMRRRRRKGPAQACRSRSRGAYCIAS